MDGHLVSISPFAILGSVAFTLVTALALFPVAIKNAEKLKLVDIPTSRRRHDRPMPIMGGITVFSAWFLGISFFSLLQPEWLSANLVSLALVVFGVGVLVLSGVIDDVKGLSPSLKLGAQLLAALPVVLLEPHVQQFCASWEPMFGILIYPMVLLWIVGCSNGINLIDGMDGLAGGMSFLVAASILALSQLTGGPGAIGAVLMAVLLPALFAFLFHNWNPARIFLGDNGSLPIGYLLSVSSLLVAPRESSWTFVAGVLIMMGYPIIDMGLCTLRRLRANNPIFKADRNHLHYRIQRLGLSVRGTVLFLLGIGASLQLSALTLSRTRFEVAMTQLAGTALWLLTLLGLIRLVERWRVFQYAQKAKALLAEAIAQPDYSNHTVICIDLEPLFEVGLFEENKDAFHILSSLRLMLQRAVRKDDRVLLSDRQISVVLGQPDILAKNAQAVSEQLRLRLDQFQWVFNLQFSLASLPVTIRKGLPPGVTGEVTRLNVVSQ